MGEDEPFDISWTQLFIHGVLTSSEPRTRRCTSCRQNFSSSLVSPETYSLFIFLKQHYSVTLYHKKKIEIIFEQKRLISFYSSPILCSSSPSVVSDRFPNLLIHVMIYIIIQFLWSVEYLQGLIVLFWWVFVCIFLCL